ncbi:MAG: hypothetical protein AAF149_02910 [Bacteroidota bacterium]
MDLDRIERLLAKYWECETSVEEERELQLFFLSDEAPDKWKSLIPLFQYYKHERDEKKLDTMFDERVIAQIEKKPSIRKHVKVRKLFYDIARVAAVGLILVTATYFIRDDYKKTTADLGTFETPEEAFEETKKALQMISKNFNKGRKEAKKVAVFNTAQEKIKKDDNEL